MQRKAGVQFFHRYFPYSLFSAYLLNPLGREFHIG